MTLRCPPGNCTLPLCSMYGMPFCSQQRKPSIISPLPLSFEVLCVCLLNDVTSLYMANKPKSQVNILCLMTFVVDLGVKGSSLILICCSLFALVTPLIACRCRISKTPRYCISCDRSFQAMDCYWQYKGSI